VTAGSPVAGRPAVIFDRDGTLIHDGGYLRDASAVRLLPGVGEALRQLAGLGFALVVASNQSGVGRGTIRPDELRAVHRRFLDEITGCGVELDGVFYCEHAPEARCGCRKPEPGLLLAAASALDLDLPRSWMIGDRETDAFAGIRAGCRSILVATSTPGVAPLGVPVVADLIAAARLVESSLAGAP
jgi:D-glycero-D-manno-heptose 1,7-bisphosphate phosphatase